MSEPQRLMLCVVVTVFVVAILLAVGYATNY